MPVSAPGTVLSRYLSMPPVCDRNVFTSCIFPTHILPAAVSSSSMRPASCLFCNSLAAPPSSSASLHLFFLLTSFPTSPPFTAVSPSAAPSTFSPISPVATRLSSSVFHADFNSSRMFLGIHLLHASYTTTPAFRKAAFTLPELSSSHGSKLPPDIPHDIL